MRRKIYFKPWVKNLPKLILVFAIFALAGYGMYEYTNTHEITTNKIVAKIKSIDFTKPIKDQL